MNAIPTPTVSLYAKENNTNNDQVSPLIAIPPYLPTALLTASTAFCDFHHICEPPRSPAKAEAVESSLHPSVYTIGVGSVALKQAQLSFFRSDPRAFCYTDLA